MGRLSFKQEEFVCHSQQGDQLQNPSPGSRPPRGAPLVAYSQAATPVRYQLKQHSVVGEVSYDMYTRAGARGPRAVSRAWSRVACLTLRLSHHSSLTLLYVHSNDEPRFACILHTAVHHHLEISVTVSLMSSPVQAYKPRGLFCIPDARVAAKYADNAAGGAVCG